MGFANAFTERKKKLKQKFMIDKYRKPAVSIPIKEQEA